jgi:16S rRNA (guanine527-N7)-methyltransferase
MSSKTRGGARPPPDPGDSLDRFGCASAAVKRDLAIFVSLLFRWQQTHNLVAPSTLRAIWTRHVADSLQLLAAAPPFHRWVDLGSGAGFPGLVIAIAVKDKAGAEVTLVEANAKKAAFLRAAIRATEAPAIVAAERAERHGPAHPGSADVVSARALAPLPHLLPLAAPYLRADSVLLLLKGQDFVHEREAASKAWSYDVLTIPSATNPKGHVVALRNLRPRGVRR